MPACSRAQLAAVDLAVCRQPWPRTFPRIASARPVSHDGRCPFGLWRDLLALSVCFRSCYFPEFGLLLLPYVVEIDALVSSELGVDCSPFLVYGLELIVFELYPLTINLAGIEVK